MNVRCLFMACALVGLAHAPEHARAADSGYHGSLFKRAVFVVSDIDRAIGLWRDVFRFEANAVNDHTGKGGYIFELMNLPPDGVVKTVSFDAGDAQIRTMLLVEIPGIAPSANDTVHRAAVVINANGRFREIIESARSLGLSLKRPHPFTTVDGNDAIEQGIVDWDGNLILLYEINLESTAIQPATTSTSVPSGARSVPARLPP